MKPWIKTFARRGAFAIAGLGLIGSVAAFAGGPGGHGPRHHPPFGEGDGAQMSARMVERVGQRLELDAGQKERLKKLADTLQAQRKAMQGDRAPHEQLQALVAGDHFDRAAAQAQAETRAERIRQGSPAVITAAADFFDSLKPEQQAKVREFLKRGPGGPRGHGADRPDGQRGPGSDGAPGPRG